MTNKTKHTPGPWHRNIRNGGKYPVIFHGRNQHVAMVKGHGQLPPGEIEANIDLIAAAPDLLEALEGLLDCVNKTPAEQGEDIIKAKQAIAKAKGQS